MPRSRRARCNRWRTRTSSQSSVEIQVTENVVTTSSSVDNPAVVRAKDTVAASSPLPLMLLEMEQEVAWLMPDHVRPVPGFLRLIQTVGAQGTSTLHGELFTIKQLCFYLTSYVKHRQLWDPLNPLVVHCDTDPLGQVFQVDRFTLHDAIGLIKRSVVEIDNQGWTKPTGLPRGCTTADQGRDVPHTITSAVGNPPPSTSLRSAPSDNKDAIISPSTSFARSNVDEDVADGKCGRTRKMRKRRKRKRNADKTVSSASSDGGPVKVCRRRQPSFSITYSSDLGEGSHPWQFQVEMYDSDDSEVLSIQSKVTAVVKSSSDDMWFLEESDDISVELNHSFLSAKEADPPFAVEYEVDSDSDASFDDTGSESPVENIFVVCDESDIAFWADSESDNEDRSDEDIVEADKWRCCECDTINNPLHRYCDRCWKLRPGWLPEQLLSLQQKGMPSLSCSCTSWSQDHKNHIASARTQAWAERVNKSLSCQELAESVAPSNTGSLAADICQDTTAVSEAQLLVDTVSLDTTSSCVGDNVLQETCQVTSAVPSSIQVSQSDTSLDIGQTNLSRPPPVGSSIAHHEHSDTNTSDTGSIPSNTHFSVNLRHCDTMPIMDSLAQQQSANFFGDSLRTSSVVSADSVDTDSLVTSVTRDDSGIGLGLCSHIPDCDDLAMADIYKHGPREMSTPTTPRQVTTECVTSDSLGASFDVLLNHPSTPVKNTFTSTSNTLQSSDVCVICLTRPKEASIIHGNTGHQVCCYVCAKRLRHRRMPCPVCRRPISGVIKNYIL